MAWSNHHFGVAQRLGDWRADHRSVPAQMMYSHFYHGRYMSPEEAKERTMTQLKQRFPDYEWREENVQHDPRGHFVIVCEGTKKCCTQPA